MGISDYELKKILDRRSDLCFSVLDTLKSYNINLKKQIEDLTMANNRLRDGNRCLRSEKISDSHNERIKEVMHIKDLKSKIEVLTGVLGKTLIIGLGYLAIGTFIGAVVSLAVNRSLGG